MTSTKSVREVSLFGAGMACTGTAQCAMSLEWGMSNARHALRSLTGDCSILLTATNSAYAAATHTVVFWGPGHGAFAGYRVEVQAMAQLWRINIAGKAMLRHVLIY